MSETNTAVAEAPATTPAVEVPGAARQKITVHLYVNNALSKQSGRTHQILTGRCPADSPLAGKRVVCFPKEFWGPVENPASHPEMNLNLQDATANFQDRNQPLPKLDRVAGLFVRKQSDGVSRPAGTLTNPLDGNYQLPRELVGARVHLREAVGMEQGQMVCEIDPQQIDSDLRNRLFPDSQPAPTTAEIAATVPTGEIPF
jgi:hypothetical protein